MIAFLLLLLYQASYFEIRPGVAYIGSQAYTVEYSSETLGKTSYPLDDTHGHRIMTLPTMEGQQPVSIMHEEIHACMHDHSHHFKTELELRKHLFEQTYSEEEIATILAPCLLALKNVDLRQSNQGKTNDIAR